MNKIGPRILLIALFAWPLAGCYRGYYRRQADAEAQALIRQKMNDPRWNQINPTVDIRSDSRMHDPFSADHPPLPPDDPASHQLMARVDDKPGYPHWHANGDTCFVESPDWQNYLPLNEDGVLEVDLDTAVRLALLHSPEYQRQRESLYLSALDVSLERFGFDAQAFSSFNAVFDATRTRSSAGLSPLGSNRTSLEKLGITGTQLVAGLANSIVWNFNGPDTQSASSLIDFSILQPLLRRAGRDRIMESLTQAERNLLADVRQMERFRRGFYLFVTTGRSPGSGPGSNFLSSPSGGISNAGGYLGLLQSQQEIRIQEFNVRSLQNAVNQFREFFTEQRVPLIQVTQVENNLLNGQTTLLRSKVTYENQLDSFKIDLGLPPDLPIIIRDPFLDQFQLIDDEFLQQQVEIIAVRDRIGMVTSQIKTNAALEDLDEQEEFAWSDELKQLIEGLNPVLDSIEPLYQRISQDDVAVVRKDFEKLESIRQERIAKFQRLRAMIEASDIEFEIESTILEPSQIVALDDLENGLQDVLDSLAQLTVQAQTLRQSINEVLERGPTMDNAELSKKVREDIVFEAPELLTQFYNALVELTLLQARARTDTISLPNVNIADEAAIAIAYAFRRDLMNARAALVDQWRQIEFIADDLEATLDLEINGSVGSNDVNNIFRVRWETAQFGTRLSFDAPITRLAERNQYRQVLIRYQQARREFYSFQDEIKRNLRATIRNMEQNNVLFELNRRSIKTSVQEVEQAQLDLIKPVAPGQEGASFDSNLARNLTDALFNLQQAQNGFLGVFVNFEVLRRGLDFDLGTMQLTPDGFWLDPGDIEASIALRAAEAYGIPVETLCLPADLLLGTEAAGTVEPDAPAPGISDDYYGTEAQLRPTVVDSVEQSGPADRASGLIQHVANEPADLSRKHLVPGGNPSRSDANDVIWPQVVRSSIPPERDRSDRPAQPVQTAGQDADAVKTARDDSRVRGGGATVKKLPVVR